jgi:hypothetical protein
VHVLHAGLCGKELFDIQDRRYGIGLRWSDGEATGIAIQPGPLADITMQQKPIGQSCRLLVASRGYLAAHCRPQPRDPLATGAIKVVLYDFAPEPMLGQCPTVTPSSPSQAAEP